MSFEGGDGAGKSTQAHLLGDWLRGLGREVVLTREPGGTELGQLLRDAVLHGDHVDARTEALLYATDRAHHVASLVRPALERGAVVVTDRYLDSSVAYQGSGRDLGADEVERLSLWAVDGLLPALTVLLDLDPVEGRGRLTGDPDRLERAGDEFHRRTREAFLGSRGGRARPLARARRDPAEGGAGSGDPRADRAAGRRRRCSGAPAGAGAAVAGAGVP